MIVTKEKLKPNLVDLVLLSGKVDSDNNELILENNLNSLSFLREASITHIGDVHEGLFIKNFEDEKFPYSFIEFHYDFENELRQVYKLDLNPFNIKLVKKLEDGFLINHKISSFQSVFYEKNSLKGNNDASKIKNDCSIIYHSRHPLSIPFDEYQPFLFNEKMTFSHYSKLLDNMYKNLKVKESK